MHITPLAFLSADEGADGDVLDLDRLLEQVVEDEAAVAGAAAVEAEGELVRVVVEVLATTRSSNLIRCASELVDCSLSTSRLARPLQAQAGPT
jgi:hypothetical protein